MEGVKVPAVYEQSYEKAYSKLKEAGFKVSRAEGYSDTIPIGNVISQNPKAGEMVPKGSEIKEQSSEEFNNNEVINNQDVVNNSTELINDVNSQVVNNNNVIVDNQPVINNPIVDNSIVNNSVVSETFLQPYVNHVVSEVTEVPVNQIPVAEIVDNNVDTNLEIFEF